MHYRNDHEKHYRMPNKIFIMYVMSVCSKLQLFKIMRHNNGHISSIYKEIYKTFFWRVEFKLKFKIITNICTVPNKLWIVYYTYFCKLGERELLCIMMTKFHWKPKWSYILKQFIHSWCIKTKGVQSTTFVFI